MRLHVGVHAAAFSIQFSRKPFESHDETSARPSGAVPAVSAESNSAIDSPARLYEIVWEVVAASFEPPAQTASAGVDPAAAPIIIVESTAVPGGSAAIIAEKKRTASGWKPTVAMSWFPVAPGSVRGPLAAFVRSEPPRAGEGARRVG